MIIDNLSESSEPHFLKGFEFFKSFTPEADILPDLVNIFTTEKSVLQAIVSPFDHKIFKTTTRIIFIAKFTLMVLKNSDIDNTDDDLSQKTFILKADMLNFVKTILQYVTSVVISSKLQHFCVDLEKLQTLEQLRISHHKLLLEISSDLALFRRTDNSEITENATSLKSVVCTTIWLSIFKQFRLIVSFCENLKSKDSNVRDFHRAYSNRKVQINQIIQKISQTVSLPFLEQLAWI